MSSYNKMFAFTKKCFFYRISIFIDFSSVHLLSCISMNNQEFKVTKQVLNLNWDEPVFFPFSVKTSKCSGSCNNVNNPYAKLCVPDVAENLNVRAFNLELMKQELMN